MRQSLLSLSHFAAILFAAFAGSVFAQVSIVPAAPKLFDTVRVQVPAGAFGSTSDLFDFRATRVSMTGNTINVALVSPGRGAGLPEPSPKFDVPLGQLPSGEYQVAVRVEAADGTMLRSVGNASFSIPAKTFDAPIFNMTDLWWNPSESGWGLNLVQHSSNIVFATWFMYEPDGTATWYVVPEGRWVAGTGYIGPIYRTTGPVFCFEGEACTGPSFDSSAVTRTQVGEMQLSIDPSDFDRATVHFTINGKTLTRTITRQGF